MLHNVFSQWFRKLTEITDKLKDTGHIFADKNRTRRRHETEVDTVRLALVPVDKFSAKSDKFTEPLCIQIDEIVAWEKWKSP